MTESPRSENDAIGVLCKHLHIKPPYMQFIASGKSNEFITSYFVSHILQEAQNKQEPPIVGLDVEFMQEDATKGRRPLFLQLATRKQAYVWYVGDGITDVVKAILLDDRIIKVGVAIEEDCASIQRHLGIVPKPRLDLRLVFGGLGVEGLVELITDTRCSKLKPNEKTRGLDSVSLNHVVYAAMDAWLHVVLYQTLRHMNPYRDLLWRSLSDEPGSGFKLEKQRINLAVGNDESLTVDYVSHLNGLIQRTYRTTPDKILSYSIINRKLESSVSENRCGVVYKVGVRLKHVNLHVECTGWWYSLNAAKYEAAYLILAAFMASYHQQQTSSAPPRIFSHSNDVIHPRHCHYDAPIEGNLVE